MSSISDSNGFSGNFSNVDTRIVPRIGGPHRDAEILKI